MATDATTENVNTATGEVVSVHSVNTDQLKSIASFEDALAVMRETYGETAVVLASDALGDGFALLQEKDSLIGVGCAFISWNESLGDFGPFVAARIVTEDNRKVVITDGSEGIYRQLSTFSQETGRNGGLVARHGLRRSDYTYTDDKGQERPAKTYYVDTSA